VSAAARAGARGRRLIAADEVRPRGLTIAFEADAEERAALARRLDLMALEALSAQLRFEAADEGEGAIRVTGTIRAGLVQSCIATLEPVPRTVNESISALYAPLPAEQPAQEVEVLAEGDEAEPLPEGGIDVGEVVAEHLALLLDPYPRHPDAPADPLTYSAGEDGSKKDTLGDDEGAGPFAALGQLKSKL